MFQCIETAAEIVDECLPLAVLFQLGDFRFLWHLLALLSSYRLNAQVEFADNKPVICPTICTTHSVCHSDILSVLPSPKRCQCLERGFIHDVFLRVGRRKTVLVISNSCSAHFLKRRRPLLLHFPTPSNPITPSQV